MATNDELAQLFAQVTSTEEGRSSFQRLLDQMASEKAQEVLKAKEPERVSLLRQLFDSYCTPQEFAVGDLVVWKDGLKNRRMPEYSVPGVVAEVLDTPVLDEHKEAGSAYYREPLTIKVGILDPTDDELLFWHFDGARFRKADL